ncbi:MAG: hypothetical protein OXH57_11010 [Ekhidna sp.]|nr:hypothetical protein [Ekhidna sp.]
MIAGRFSHHKEHGDWHEVHKEDAIVKRSHSRQTFLAGLQTTPG